MQKLALVLLLVGCSKGGKSLERRWLDAKWTPVSGELRYAGHFTAEVPEGLPENTNYLLGKDWWQQTDVEHLADSAGPRLTLTPEDRTFAGADDFAREVEPDPKRADLVVIAKEAKDGRLRFVSQVKGGSHLDVSVWIPSDAAHGVHCDAHWWWGPDLHGDAKRDPALVSWLDRFCQSVKLGAK